ncbi:uncharacterized protein EKO05_0010162 [Ascochyta rabiei]|uniref:uncharacterized protein n=1 Tax=Didymella rabiei TaxID=5454 RepID=UPI002204FA47|nr:uncharacterized protein EKO05_0010162 [Ascochyta rabiei]UPX19913.1 hypothetical protein EKO05_0010162 [Ascochyta rabiei]
MDLSSVYAYQNRQHASPNAPHSPTPKSSAMSHTAFFYGTLMAPPVLHRVIWGSPTPPTPAHAALLSIRPAKLHAHQRRKVRHADYPAVVPAAPEDEVRGTLVEGLTDGDIWRLDIFEGHEYERQSVRVKVLEAKGRAGDAEHKDVEGEEVDAQTYLWTAGEHRLETEEWDFDHFVKEKMSRWVGGEAADEGFQDVDDAVAAQQDPTGGRAADGTITRQLQREDQAEEKRLESAV